ncbi:phosphate starvation-inducible protein PhoH [Candidatus Geothermarchaeota archaeon ex4572_27]|nr:MAG: phosphate starvation-inducible protein PhoH [Candidatus Geothermarchaeota archaeon ex4572_27]
MSIKPLSKGQEEFCQALQSRDYDIVGVFGPTGSGKSLISIAYGIEAVKNGEYTRFIISRPVVDIVTGKEISTVEAGSLYYELASNYLRDVTEGVIEWEEVKKLIDDGKVVFADTHYLRGRTFDKSIILVDDAQALPPESSLEILMRIGRDSKMIVAGDPIFQKPLGVEVDGASLLREILLGEEKAKVIDLGLKDIIRPGAKRGIRLLLEARMRKRQLNDVEAKIMDLMRVHAPDADVITVIELVKDKEKWGITSEHTPDALIIVKEGSIGRAVGKGGERIQKVEEEAQMRLRVIEMTLNFNEVIRAIHPVSWIYKHVVDADFRGPDLVFTVNEENFGPFVGQRGFHIKFIDGVFKRLIGVGARAAMVGEEGGGEEERKPLRRKRKAAA